MRLLNNQEQQLIAGGADPTEAVACVEDVLVAIDECIKIWNPVVADVLKSVITVGKEMADADGPAIQAAILEVIQKMKVTP